MPSMVCRRNIWKKRRPLDCAQPFVLLRRLELRETREPGDPGPVDLARRRFTLIPVLRQRLDERTLRVSVFVAAVRTGQLAVNVDHHAGFGGARTALVARKNPFAGGRDHARLPGGEEAQRHADRALLRLQPQRLARQRVQQNAAHRLAGRVINSRRFMPALPAA